MDILDTAESVVDPVIQELKEYLAIVATQVLKEYLDTQELKESLEIQDIAVFQDTAIQMAYLVIAESKDSLDTLVLQVTVGTQEYLVRLVIAESKESVVTPGTKEFRVIAALKAPLDILESKEYLDIQE